MQIAGEQETASVESRLKCHLPVDQLASRLHHFRNKALRTVLHTEQYAQRTDTDATPSGESVLIVRTRNPHLAVARESKPAS